MITCRKYGKEYGNVSTAWSSNIPSKHLEYLLVVQSRAMKAYLHLNHYVITIKSISERGCMHISAGTVNGDNELNVKLSNLVSAGEKTIESESTGLTSFGLLW